MWCSREAFRRSLCTMIITLLLILMILLLDLVAIVQVIVGDTPAQHKAAWILAILLLPVVGMVAFYLTVPPDVRENPA